MHNLPRSLLDAQDEQERRQWLDEILTIHIAPLLRQVVRQVLLQRLGSSRDAEDLYQEAMTRILEAIRKSANDDGR